MTITTKSPPFSLRIPIRFSHCDPAGYVFFPRFFEMIQAVCEDWFTQELGLNFSEMIIQHRLGQPTAYTECQFIKPCLLGENLDMAIILDKYGTSSLHLRFIGTVAGEIRLCARSVQVVISLENGRPVRIHGDLRKRLQEYMDNVEVAIDIEPQRR
ncbi:MAG: acyl-CoA thioesterase [Gammaproteobacteria bacterium]|nr:acyl-CoA thioesterase [Gammaproteobacteria bacterium]